MSAQEVVLFMVAGFLCAGTCGCYLVLRRIATTLEEMLIGQRGRRM